MVQDGHFVVVSPLTTLPTASFSKAAVDYGKSGNGGLSQDQIEEYATAAYRQYYLRPQYVGMMVKRAFRSRDDFAQTLRLGKAFVRRKALGWI